MKEARDKEVLVVLHYVKYLKIIYRKMSVGKIRNNSIGGFPMAGQKQQPGGNHSGIRAVLSLGDVMVHSTVSLL